MDSRHLSTHELADYKNMSDHLRQLHDHPQQNQKDRSDDHATRFDSAQVQGAYSP